MVEVAPDIHMITVPTPFPVGPVNSYLITGEPVTLIDPGPAYSKARQALEEGLRECGLVLSDVDQVILTHGHIDHAGLSAEVVAARIQAAQPMARVFVHKEDLYRVAHHDDYVVQRTGAYVRIARECGTPLEVMSYLDRIRLATFFKTLGHSLREAEPIEDGHELETGIGPLRVVWTPGHTRGCVCLVSDERRVVFTGDTVLRAISSNPSLDFEGEGISMMTYLESLDRLRAYEGYLVLPGHRSPVESLVARIQELRDDIDTKLNNVDSLLTDSPLSIYELSRRLYGDYEVSELILALAETRDLVRVLSERGRAELVEIDGVQHAVRAR